MAKNPKWTRDELILALDLYFRVNPLHTSEKNPEIIALSDLLNQLPIHTDRPDVEKFRNPNGVYMKLCNFLRFDPGYSGKGLTAGAKLEEDIWNEFASDRGKLSKTAHSIKANYQQVAFSKPEPGITDYENDEFQEGRILTKLHKMRERNRTAVAKKKKSVLEATGALVCEVCAFDFFKFYGEIGFGFAECHHTIPLYELEPNAKTKLSDLGIVCANCHRMLHRARLWKSISELREMVSNKVGWN